MKKKSSLNDISEKVIQHKASVDKYYPLKVLIVKSVFSIHEGELQGKTLKARYLLKTPTHSGFSQSLRNSNPISLIELQNAIIVPSDSVQVLFDNQP